MAQSPYSILNFDEPRTPPPPATVDLPERETTTRSDKSITIEIGDGSVIIDLDPSQKTTKTNKFSDNLANIMDEVDLNKMAEDLLRGIQADEDSRREWLQQHAEGIEYLGFIIEKSSSTAGSEGAPLEGMNRGRHPLLAEATILFNAQAVGELLPAAGPAKIRDDQPSQSNPYIPPMPQLDQRDPLADALEKDFNHYLTAVAKEFYPDTDRMFFGVGYGGQGIKKVYNCPIRRRPVSESVPVEDFIVSNAMTDLSSMTRKTHRIKMRHATMRRMQILEVYRDIPLTKPTLVSSPNPVETVKAEVVGVSPQIRDPEDAEHELYECYCEYDLPDYAPKQFKDKGLPLPYRVTIHKESRRVLDVRRNWKQDDTQCLEKEYFVDYSYLKAFGFYGIGLLHIVGNLTQILTATWREFIDSGMFSNFPGFVFAKGAGRQMTNNFRVAPGSGVGLDIGLQRIQDAVMPLPYKDLGPAFTQFVQHVEEVAQRVAGTANIQVGEGRQDAPVGTTLALIEQATRPIAAALKRMHSAMSKEIQLLKERFREDPEAFWRYGCKSKQPWQRDQFLRALEDCDLVPVSDPNNPTSLHRSAKAMVIQQAAIAAPGVFDPGKVWDRIGKQVNIENPRDLLAPPAAPGSQPPDPRIAGKQMDIAFKTQGLQADLAQKQQDRQLDALREMAQIEDRKAERENRIQVAMLNQQTERLRLAQTLAIHGDKAEAAREALNMKIEADDRKAAAEANRAAADRLHEHLQNTRTQDHEHEMATREQSHQHDMADRTERHELAVERIASRRPSGSGAS